MPDNENIEQELTETDNIIREETDKTSNLVNEDNIQEAMPEDSTIIETIEENKINDSKIDVSQNIDMPTVEAADETILEDSNAPVTVQPVKFASFDDSEDSYGEGSKNLDNLLDIKLQLTVELGRATLSVKKVLELTRGSIVELEKVAGEPVELYANGKLIAHGEVVVIEDNFGLRITSMTDPEPKLNVLK